MGNGLVVGDGLSDGDGLDDSAGLGDTAGVGVALGLTLGEASRDVLGEAVADPLGWGEEGGSAAELLVAQAEMAAQASNASMNARAAASIARSPGLAAASCAFMDPP